MGFFALRTAAGTGKSLAVFKYISTGQAAGRCNRNGFILGSNRACDMRQMFRNLFFRDPHFPGNLSGTQLFVTQQ